MVKVPQAAELLGVDNIYVDWIGDLEAARSQCDEHGVLARLCENVFGGVDLLIGRETFVDEYYTGREARAFLLPDSDPVLFLDDLISALLYGEGR